MPKKGQRVVFDDGRTGYVWATWLHYGAPVVHVALDGGGVREAWVHKLAWIGDAE